MSMSHSISKGAAVRLPAEWERQEAVWLAWPQNQRTWGRLLPDIEAFYLKLCSTILDFEDLYLLCSSEELAGQIQGKVESNRMERFHPVCCETDDCWARDYGGITVIKTENGTRKRLMNNFMFNAWGGKYPTWEKDDKIPVCMSKYHGIDCLDAGFVLEGGAIDSNGAGILLASDNCLLLPSRNPGMSRAQYENRLAELLGTESVIWTYGELQGDDTDGHVDNLMRFTGEKTLFFATESNQSGVNYKALSAFRKEAESSAARFGLDLTALPAPPLVEIEGFVAPASYLNFLIINGAVLVPSYQGPEEDKMFSLFETHFPGRRIVPIDCRRLIFGRGGLHCISMQVPAL